jgi:hypothetical protein
LPRQSFLDLQSSGKQVGNASQFAEAQDLSVGNICDVDL